MEVDDGGDQKQKTEQYKVDLKNVMETDDAAKIKQVLTFGKHHFISLEMLRHNWKHTLATSRTSRIMSNEEEEEGSKRGRDIQTATQEWSFNISTGAICQHAW